MAISDTQRRLAAILVADMVGFYHQMGADEAGNLARTAALPAEVLESLVVECRSRRFKMMGDGFLAEFASAERSVARAVEGQVGGMCSPYCRIKGVYGGL